MKFDQLNFKPRQGLSGIQATTFFPNGYGASVVKGLGTYGEDAGLFELAVLKGTATDWELCYDTPITEDVIGHLSPDRVTALLVEIEALPRA